MYAISMRGLGIAAATSMLCAFSAPVFAAVDFEASMEMLPGGNIIERGGVSEWRLTIRNTGDVAIDAPAAGTDFWDVGPDSTILLYPVAATTPCFINYTDFVDLGNMRVLWNATIIMQPRPLAPSESVSCIVGIQINEEAPRSFTQQFGFVAGMNSGGSVTKQKYVSFSLIGFEVPIPAFGFIAGMMTVLSVLALGLRAMTLRR